MADAVFTGDTVRFTGTFFNSSGALADPTSVTVRYKNEDGTERRFVDADPSVTKSGTGVYFIDVVVNRPGRWKVRFEGLGTLVTHTDIEVDVLDKDF